MLFLFYPISSKNGGLIDGGTVGEIIKIRLSADEKAESEKYEDFSEFIEILEDKYGFNLNCCSWMSCDVLSERSY